MTYILLMLMIHTSATVMYYMSIVTYVENIRRFDVATLRLPQITSLVGRLRSTNGNTPPRFQHFIDDATGIVSGYSLKIKDEALETFTQWCIAAN